MLLLLFENKSLLLFSNSIILHDKTSTNYTHRHTYIHDELALSVRDLFLFSGSNSFYILDIETFAHISLHSMCSTSHFEIANTWHTSETTTTTTITFPRNQHMKNETPYWAGLDYFKLNQLFFGLKQNEKVREGKKRRQLNLKLFETHFSRWVLVLFHY